MKEYPDKHPILRVVEERHRQGLSQSALARKAEVNQTSMSRIESGLEPPYPHRGQRIADALGWRGSYEELFEEVKD